MIEITGEPGLGNMTTLAIRNSLYREILTMHVVMAVDTHRTYLSKFPVVLLHVAGVAGRGDVRSFQREFRTSMLFEGERTRFKSIGQEVAFDTIRRHAVLRKFPFVEVLVTAIASIENDRFRKVVRVAFLAIHIHMLSL